MKSKDAHWSYAKHSEHELELSKEVKLPSCYSEPNTIDAWRHERMHKAVLPILETYPGAKWITIGDGNFGSDAYFLKENGADVLATSLTDSCLVIAKENGFINKFKSVNAEEIALPDESYDFVFCKESYHHFPRPPIALYEMLRVAKKAVVLMEPQETSKKLLNYAKDLVKKTIRAQKSTSFEPSGNFIFRVNPGEIAKMMTALNYSVIAVKKCNGFYHPKFSHAKYSVLRFSTLLTKLAIAIQDALCILKMLDYGGACIVMFKEVPDEKLVHRLKRHGFRVLYLPKNPYLKH